MNNFVLCRIKKNCAHLQELINISVDKVSPQFHSSDYTFVGFDWAIKFDDQTITHILMLLLLYAF